MSPLRILLVSETSPPEINGVAMTTQRLVALASGLGVVAYRRAAAELLIREGENGSAEAGRSMREHGREAIVERFEAVLRGVLPRQ